MTIERLILLHGMWKHDNTVVQRIPNTFKLSEEHKAIVKEEWSNKPPDAQDLPLWRYEGHEIQNEQLQINVSLCSYKWHFILRNHVYSESEMYPNPISTTTLLHTVDNKLVLGIRRGSDQGNRLHTVGGGFIDPIPAYTPGVDLDSLIPENPFATAAREITEETSVKHDEFSIQDFTLLGLVWGSNHDTTCVVHAPVNIDSERISINAPEHSELIPIDLQSLSLKSIIARGFLEGRENTPATDHCILALQLFLEKGMEKAHPNFN